MAVTTSKTRPTAREIDALSGVDVAHPGEHVGEVVLTLPPAEPATACSWVTPAGSCLLTTPEKMRLVARASIFGAAMVQVTLTTASKMITAIFDRSGRSRPTSLLKDPLKSLAFSPDPMSPGGPKPGP